MKNGFENVNYILRS